VVKINNQEPVFIACQSCRFHSKLQHFACDTLP